jgi:hypothetical protein
MERLYKKISQKEKDYNFIKQEYDNLYKKFIDLSNKKEYLHKENIFLKIKINENITVCYDNPYNNDFINDDIMNIEFDIFEESEYILKKKVKYYEEKLDCVYNFLEEHNISSFKELSHVIMFCKNNNNDVNITNTIENNEEYVKRVINLMSKEELNKMDQQINNSFKKIKNKLNTIKEGDVIIFKGIKRKEVFIKDKLKFIKIENVINKINMVEEEFTNYCKEQISWAKDILGNDYDDIKIIKLLDIFNKLIINHDNLSSSSDSENEYFEIYNDIKLLKIKELQKYIKLGNIYINKNINSKKDLSKEDLVFIKEIIKTSDIKFGTKDEKINRFINQCKRYFMISQKIPNNNNIFNNKCKTSIRDINNKDFNDLLKLLENNNKNV